MPGGDNSLGRAWLPKGAGLGRRQKRALRDRRLISTAPFSAVHGWLGTAEAPVASRRRRANVRRSGPCWLHQDLRASPLACRVPALYLNTQTAAGASRRSITLSKTVNS